MLAHFVCVLLLCFTCGGLCADVDQEQRALEEELLSSLFASKLKQSQQNAPYWRLSLDNLCRLVSGLRQEAWRSSEEEQEEEVEEQLKEWSLQRLDELYRLQHICRAQQSQEGLQRHGSLEYTLENIEAPLKRKSPYILKRHTSHSAKSRRPYILKRRAIY
uniref:neurotensin/neuromedin N n=1 Tax=Doryrhamphus excisus TaxID=161450 RepID=UPI0025AE8CD0|nr:neurotensin/neuromedin N [Doryrhamphus excisus]